MVCNENPLVLKICSLYDQISSLDSLKPSQDVNTLFTDLVLTCTPPNPIDVTKLCQQIQEIRSKLIKLSGEAEALLESHYSAILASFEHPLDHLHIFPYLSNYLKLSQLEYNILTKHCSTHHDAPTRVAFIGSGPLPLTSIVLASFHMKDAVFDNYDIDPSANSMAVRLVSSHPDLSKRMFFHTADILDVTSSELREYEVVFLAALVGMDKETKVQVIDHLAKHMAPGAMLMLRSAHGARAFLYPVVDPCDLRGFEVLSVFHPTDEVINSVLIARKPLVPVHTLDMPLCNIVFPHNCSKVQAFHPLNHGGMMEELAIDDQHA